MGLVRIGTGRDAADVSFATIFGSVRSRIPVISIAALDDPANGYDLPRHCGQALSTSSEAPESHAHRRLKETRQPRDFFAPTSSRKPAIGGQWFRFLAPGPSMREGLEKPLQIEGNTATI